jgi:protocatechuate 3,4-dioxygenase beta subunit
MVGTPGTYRSDVREDRQGVPLTLTLTVVDAASGCAPVSGANVEIWHCDADGTYSEYGAGVGATFLRGVQTTDASGKVTFTTIYPGWYQGRATHIHIEVYRGTTLVKTTQLAFPEATNQVVYGGGSPYYTKGQNPTTNETDMVFSDGVTFELAQVAGTIAGGYAAVLQVGVTG